VEGEKKGKKGEGRGRVRDRDSPSKGSLKRKVIKEKGETVDA